jgi:NCS1 family nucleobase:cation symporter-1
VVYVADYSRYLPRTTKPRTTFTFTLLGSVPGSQWAMTLGALVATLPARDGKSFLADQVGFLGSIAGPGLAAIVIYLVIVSGKLTVNSLNAYGGFSAPHDVLLLRSAPPNYAAGTPQCVP